MSKPLFDVTVSIDKEFCDETGTEISFEAEIDDYDADLLFKYCPLNTGNLFLNTSGELLEANMFHSIGKCEDASYCESADESSVYFSLVCSDLLQRGGKFLFTFMNELEETVNLLLEVAEDYSLKTEFVV
jgi:hypothetical protein